VAITALAPEPSSSLSWIVLDLRQFFDAALDHFAARRRTRVAALVIPATWRDCVEHLFVGMAARGMSTDTYLVQSVSERHPHWANPCVRSLMRSGEGRPDGLFITDDTLVEDALAGLVASGLRVPADVEVVTHCNFPWPAPSVLPVKRLGYDVRLLLQKALQLVDPSVRRGKSTECMTMPAIFGDQQT
jgi:DNA-binding LacI/PurR family transcriptional regulator